VKRALLVIVTCIFAPSAAIADDAHDHGAEGKQPPVAAAKGMGGMHEHMKLMREQMAQIRAATDSKEKERLMNEHMKSMEQSMSKMQGMMGCGKM
jgi:hypothetical protein